MTGAFEVVAATHISNGGSLVGTSGGHSYKGVGQCAGDEYAALNNVSARRGEGTRRDIDSEVDIGGCRKRVIVRATAAEHSKTHWQREACDTHLSNEFLSSHI